MKIKKIAHLLKIDEYPYWLIEFPNREKVYYCMEGKIFLSYNSLDERNIPKDWDYVEEVGDVEVDVTSIHKIFSMGSEEEDWPNNYVVAFFFDDKTNLSRFKNLDELIDFFLPQKGGRKDIYKWGMDKFGYTKPRDTILAEIKRMIEEGESPLFLYLDKYTPCDYICITRGIDSHTRLNWCGVK